MSYTLRALLEADLDEAVALTVENFAGEGQAMGRYDPCRIRKRLESALRGDEYAPRFVVAISDKDGMIGVAGWGRLEVASRTWGLFLSSVERQHRGQGVGTALVIERLRRIGEETDKGRVLVSTKHRKRFERLGFRSVDFDRELSLHLMLKRLGQVRDLSKRGTAAKAISGL